MALTDAEIVAYNAGVAAQKVLGAGDPDWAVVYLAARETMGERERAALARLGADAFWAWVHHGALDAHARAAR